MIKIYSSNNASKFCTTIEILKEYGYLQDILSCKYLTFVTREASRTDPSKRDLDSIMQLLNFEKKGEHAKNIKSLLSIFSWSSTASSIRRLARRSRLTEFSRRGTFA